MYIVHVRHVRCILYSVHGTLRRTVTTLLRLHVQCTSYSVRRTVYVESEKIGEDIEKKDPLNYDEREIEMRRKSYRMVAIYGTSQR